MEERRSLIHKYVLSVCLSVGAQKGAFPSFLIPDRIASLYEQMINSAFNQVPSFFVVAHKLIWKHFRQLREQPMLRYTNRKNIGFQSRVRLRQSPGLRPDLKLGRGGGENLPGRRIASRDPCRAKPTRGLPELWGSKLLVKSHSAELYLRKKLAR